MVHGSDNQLFGSAQRCEQCFIAFDRCFNRSLVLKNAPNAQDQKRANAQAETVLFATVFCILMLGCMDCNSQLATISVRGPERIVIATIDNYIAIPLYSQECTWVAASTRRPSNSTAPIKHDVTISLYSQ